MPSTWTLRLGVLLTTLFSTSCLQSGYLLQAVYGQDELSSRRRPIAQVLADERVDERTRAMLALIDDVKRYGELHGLEATGNYSDYVALDRSVVVYVVSAAHPLKFESVTWGFPIVGSVPYLGWFNLNDAKKFASRLAREGYDVDLRGASAYSTLGWFDDPILSTMIRPRETVVGDLVNVVLHESVHATHYVNSQSPFNENMADFVADTLALAYLQKRLRLDRWQLLAYEQAAVRRERRAIRFHQAHQELTKVYASAMSDAGKLAEKRRITEALQRELDFWRPINNAVLAQSHTYHASSPVFTDLFDCVGRDWQRFWKKIKTIDSSSFTEPQQQELAAVMAPLQSGCKAP